MKIEINETITIRSLKLFLYSAYKNQSWGAIRALLEALQALEKEDDATN